MNGNDLQSEWFAICEKIISYPNINTSQFNAFVARLKPQAMSSGYMMLTADNDFIKSWVEKHYITYIKEALSDIYGVDYHVDIEVDPNQVAQEPMTPIVIEKNDDVDSNPVSTQKDETVEVKTEASIAQEVDRAENKEEWKSSAGSIAGVSSYTFSNFVIGDSNNMAYSMAVAVAEDPGKPMLNPLFIYGKSGLGKTHLLRAIQNYIIETRPEFKTVYVDSAEFLSEYIEAAIGHEKDKASYQNFKKNYEQADILLIDDVQYLQGKQQTLDIVFQIFKKMTEEGRQVVLSADRAPKNIDIDERYQSRFNAGGTYDIQPPEVETKLGIIKSFVEEYKSTSGQEDFILPDDICKYIAENSSSNIRELKSAVTKIIFRLNSFDEPLSIAEVRDLLENHFSGGPTKKLSVADIQKQVETYYKISHADLIGKKRSRNITYARQIAIYLCRQMLDLPFSYIAMQFGNRDHTTIMYSVNSVAERISENRETREEIENIKRFIHDM